MNWSAELMALVPSAVVTVTLTVPDPTGLVAAIWVALLTVYVAIALPKLTVVAPVKLVPVIVTGVPPAVVPLVGATNVTVGALT